jgi:hypothetical protein
MVWVVCTLLCGLASWRSNILTFFLWYKPDKHQHSHFLMFYFTVKIHFCSPKQEVDMNNTFLISKGCNHDFSCWWHTVELFLPWKCHVASFGLLPVGFRFKVVHPGGILQGPCLLIVTNTERCEARAAITTDLLYWKYMGVKFLALYCILYKHSINT